MQVPLRRFALSGCFIVSEGSDNSFRKQMCAYYFIYVGLTIACKAILIDYIFIIFD